MLHIARHGGLPSSVAWKLAAGQSEVEKRAVAASAAHAERMYKSALKAAVLRTRDGSIQRYQLVGLTQAFQAWRQQDAALHASMEPHVAALETQWTAPTVAAE